MKAACRSSPSTLDHTGQCFWWELGTKRCSHTESGKKKEFPQIHRLKKHLKQREEAFKRVNECYPLQVRRADCWRKCEAQSAVRKLSSGFVCLKNWSWFWTHTEKHKAWPWACDASSLTLGLIRQFDIRFTCMADIHSCQWSIVIHLGWGLNFRPTHTRRTAGAVRNKCSQEDVAAVWGHSAIYRTMENKTRGKQ